MNKKKLRQPCPCQASEHRLISNCLSCGRIICDREGLPCLYCSSLPPSSCYPPPLSSPLPPPSSFPPSSSPPSPSLERALRMKEQLLAFDRNQAAENSVFDEQLDYFELNENVWLSKEVKEQAVKEIIEEKKVREESSRGINVQFKDGRWEEVKEKRDENASKQEAQHLYQKNLQKERETREKQGSKEGEGVSFDDRVGDQVYIQLRNDWNEKYKEYREKKEKKQCEETKMFKVIAHDEGFSGGFVEVFEKKLGENGKRGDLNMYDREIFDFNGESGKCLSMLQPWASLMVEGFKRFEGRFWNTEYRGPLWVHAGATQPDPETIRKVENQYLSFYENEKNVPPLPERYPTGCIIGIVDLQYVLKREDYEDLIPNQFKEETDCDFLFVIRNPRKLVYPLKAIGSKQIYDIDANLREKAKKLVVRVQTNWFKYIMDEIKYIEKKMEPILQEEKKPKEEEEEIIKENDRIDDNSLVEEVPTKTVTPKREEKNKNIKNDGRNEEYLLIKRNYSKKIEKVSFCLQEVLLKEDQKTIIDIFEEQLAGKKFWGPNNMISTFNEENFSFLKVFNEIIEKEGKSLKKKKFQMDAFYVNKKQKLFTFNGKYICLLNIGLELEIMVTSQDEVVLMEIKSGAMFFFDSKYQTSFQSVKEAGKKGEAYSLIVIFY